MKLGSLFLETSRSRLTKKMKVVIVVHVSPTIHTLEHVVIVGTKEAPRQQTITTSVLTLMNRDKKEVIMNDMKQLVMADLLLHGDSLNDMHDDPRDKSPLDMVKEYQEVSGQKPNETLYRILITEETQEWLNEVEDYLDYSANRELKELSDLVYVIYGYANARGWDLDEAVRRVHDNNMGRMFQEDGTIKRREDGKIIKNNLYPKVNLEDLV